MTCKHGSSGCNSPEGKCVGLCMPTAIPASDPGLDLEAYKPRVLAAVTEAATKTHMNIHMLAEVRQAILNVNLGDCDD